jgi:hypothetical protein
MELPLQISDHLCHRVLWWDRYQDVNVIRHQVPFLNLAFLAPCEFVEYGSQVLPNLPEQQLLAVLWCDPMSHGSGGCDLVTLRSP